jgi:hypothetical protein
MPFTPYPDVDAVLQQLLAGARAALGEQFVALYLYGSLSSGDFNPASSDIDFVVVTQGALAPAQVAALEALHVRLWAEAGPWAAHLEGSYIPRDALRRYDPAMPPVPTVWEGRFYLGGHGPDWIIQRHVMREHGLVLAGPPPAALIDPVAPDDLRRAVRGILHDFWGSVVLNDPNFLLRADYRAFAVLTMCRAWHVLAHGDMISKPAAARWALANLPPRWHDLIAQAAAWQPGREVGTPGLVGEFIRAAVAAAEAPEAPSLAKLLAGLTPANRPPEQDIGGPAGGEAW